MRRKIIWGSLEERSLFSFCSVKLLSTEKREQTAVKTKHFINIYLNKNK